MFVMSSQKNKDDNIQEKRKTEFYDHLLAFPGNFLHLSVKCDIDTP